jgi:simple sugar transport system permease protein
VEVAEPPRGGPQTQHAAELAWGLVRALPRRREASIALIALLLVVYFATSASTFLTGQNARELFEYAGAPALIASGEVMLLICGEIDLSAGNVYAFAPWIMYFAAGTHMPILLALMLGLLAAAAVGLVNGISTVFVGVPSFITTLAMLFVLNGITLVASHGYPVSPPGGHVLNAVLGNYPYSSFYWAIVIVAVMQMVLTSTRWGVYTIAAGSNLLGAAESGINVRSVKIGNFVCCSVLGGFAGMLDSFRLDTIDPLQGGTAIMLTAIAAAVIGGTSLLGGSGTIAGALIGVAILSILNDGFTLLGVNAYWFDVVQGMAIFVAVVLNLQVQRRRNWKALFRRGGMGGAA